MTSIARRLSARRSRVFADVTALVWLSLATGVSTRPPPRVATFFVAPACPLGQARSVAFPVHVAVLWCPAAFQSP